jgi:hypothetical protein
MRRMGVLVAAVTLGLSAALTGCGSDEPTQTENTSNENQAAEDTSNQDEPAPEEGGGSEVSGSDQEYCEMLQTAQTDLSELTNVDPQKNTGALEEVAKTVQEISDTAPAEVQEHWTVMADTMNKSVEALEKLDEVMKDPTSVDQAELTKLQKEMEQAADDAQQASDAVVADTKTRCGFQLETGQ